MKFADILYLPGILHHLLQNTQIRSKNLDCRSKNVVYLISCKFVTNHITGSSEEFRARVTDYRFARRNYRKNMKVNSHFAVGVHSGESDRKERLF